MISTLRDKFPGLLARYDDEEKAAEPVPVVDETHEKFKSVFLDALKKTDDLARSRYMAAYMDGLSFLTWAREHMGKDFADYIALEVAIDELWEQKAPLESFMAALRSWAGAYLFLARCCHYAVIAEINQHLKKQVVSENGLG